MINFKEKLANIKAFVFDVDGVLGSSKVLVDSDGEMLRSSNVKDGYALQYAAKRGYVLAIISGGKSEVVYNRYKNLGMVAVYMQSHNKIDDFNDFLSKNNLQASDVLYMGDDIPDYEVMTQVGVATCPADAVEEIKSISHYVSHLKGGEGCVRDVVEQVLKLQGKWMDNNACKW